MKIKIVGISAAIIFLLLGCKPITSKPYRVVAKKSGENTYVIEDMAYMGTDPYKQLASDALNAQIRGDWKKVKKLALQMLALDPLKYTGYFDLGIAQVQLGEYAESIPNLEKALDQSPDASRAWEALAIAYYKVGKIEKYEQARDHYEILKSKK